MKLLDLYEQANTDYFDIISVHQSDDWGNGSSRRGTIDVPYNQLVTLFGEPEDFQQQENRDINLEWRLDIVYRNKATPNQEDPDMVFVSIWDKHYGDNVDNDPQSITRWIINAKSNEAATVLREVISKNIKISG